MTPRNIENTSAKYFNSDNRLSSCPNKCHFSTNTIEYLGYILFKDSLTMSPTKVQAIQDWPELRKVKEIQSSLCFANFYRWFITNYSDIVVPLIRTTRKGIPWSFSPEAQQSLETLKSAFTSAPILFHWIQPLIVIQNDSGKIHPVTFHSCTFTSLELNYDTCKGNCSLTCRNYQEILS